MMDTHHYDHAGETEVTKRLADTIKARHFDFWYSTGTISAAPIKNTQEIATWRTCSRSLSLSVPAGTHTDISMTRIDGTMVRRASLEGGTALHRIEGLAPGIYLLDMKNNGRHKHDRVVIR